MCTSVYQYCLLYIAHVHIIHVYIVHVYIIESRVKTTELHCPVLPVVCWWWGWAAHPPLFVPPEFRLPSDSIADPAAPPSRFQSPACPQNQTKVNFSKQTVQSPACPQNPTKVNFSKQTVHSLLCEWMGETVLKHMLLSFSVLLSNLVFYTQSTSMVTSGRSLSVFHSFRQHL